MRITCDRCGKDRMLNETHTPERQRAEAHHPGPMNMPMQRIDVSAKTVRLSGGITMRLRTRLTDMLGIEHPILLAPMNVIAGGKLAAAVTGAGGLGLIGGGYGDADWLERQHAAAGTARVGCGFITWWRAAGQARDGTAARSRALGSHASRCLPLRAGFGERIFTEAALARIADPVALAIHGIEWHATAQAWPAQGRCRDSARFGIVGLRGGRSCEP